VIATIRIYPESWASMNVDQAGKKYRPCNGSEGELFIGTWCGTCERDHGMLKGLPLEECDDNQVCDIIARTFTYSVDEPEYPAEWKYGKDGQPRCTAYVPEGQPIPAKDDRTLDMFSDTGKLAELDGQCGDCGGTGRKDGKPCPTCAPTEDGPADGGGE
jgi:hypothetical protein